MIVIVWLDMKAIFYGNYYSFGYYGSGFLFLNPNSYRGNALLNEIEPAFIAGQTKPYYDDTLCRETKIIGASIYCRTSNNQINWFSTSTPNHQFNSKSNTFGATYSYFGII